MPRPRKCRRVCRLPSSSLFTPANVPSSEDCVIMTIDEYETIRLIDAVGLSQEECSDFMGVSRTTAQQIYADARKKLGRMLVEAIPLRIEGGSYEICDAGCAECGQYCPRMKKNLSSPQLEQSRLRNQQGGNPMKYAIPLDENKRDVCPAFARAPYFLFRQDDSDEILENPAAQAEGGAGLQAAQFLVDANVTVLITPRCGENAGAVFQAAGIEIYKTTGSDALQNLADCKAGKLQKLTHFHAGYHGVQ